jgi:transposase
MPKLLRARPARDAVEEHLVQRLAGSRHAPGDWIQRARMIARSWDGLRTGAIAGELRCHPQTVRERVLRFNAEGVDGLGAGPGPGRRPRLTEAERSTLVALARSAPPGQPQRWEHGALEPDDRRAAAPAHWTLDRLVEAARARGIAVARSQVRRILLKGGVPWRGVRSWARSTDPEFAPKGRPSSAATRSRRRAPR